MRSFAVALLSLSLVTGCFEADESITLNADLSGTADFKIVVNHEPIIVSNAWLERALKRKSGAPTPAELAEAKADYIAQLRSKPGDIYSLEQIDEALPGGVRALQYDESTKPGDRTSMNVRIGFDSVESLRDAHLPRGDNFLNLPDAPFTTLDVADQDGIITIRATPPNPAGSGEEPPPGEWGPNLLETVRVTYRITAPFAVVEHNADRRDGTRWCGITI